MKPLQIFSILLALGLFSACATTSDTGPSYTFNDAVLGFSITKPSGWNYVSGKIMEVNKNANRQNNPELEKVSQQTGDTPFLVVFARYPEPNPNNNPTVSVTVIDTGVEGLSPKRILALPAAKLKKAYPDLTIVEEIRDHEVDGIIGAYTKLKFTVAGDGERKFPTTHRMWLVPRGTLMFSIAMTGPQEGPDVSEEAFQEILQSIKIAR